MDQRHDLGEGVESSRQDTTSTDAIDDFTVEIASIGKIAESDGTAFWLPSSPITEPVVEWSVTGKNGTEQARSPKPSRPEPRRRGWYQSRFWVPEGKKTVRFTLKLTVHDALGRVAEGTAPVERGGAFKEIDELLPGAFVVTLPANRLLKKAVRAAYGASELPLYGFEDGHARYAAFRSPGDVAVDQAGNIYVADSGNHRVRMITASGTISTLAGTGLAGFRDGAGAQARLWNPRAIVVDAEGTVYFTEQHRIRCIGKDGLVSTLAGAKGTVADSREVIGRTIGEAEALLASERGFRDGEGEEARFDRPYGLAVDAAGNLFVADSNNNRIRKVAPNGTVSTVAGTGAKSSLDGPADRATFNEPAGMALDATGNLYVAEGYRIRKVTPDGIVSTVAGSSRGYLDGPAAQALFNRIGGIALDAAGNLYVADTYNNRIRRVTPAGVVSTLAGSGKYGYRDGPGTQARFASPSGVAVDPAGNVCVADGSNHRIRKVEPGGVVETFAGPQD